MVVRVAKILIFLIAIIIVVFLAITIYKRLSVSQKNMVPLPEDVIRPCEQRLSNVNTRALCSSGRLVRDGYIREAENICESLEGDWKIRCKTSIIAMQNHESEAIALCKEIENSIQRNICISTTILFSNSSAAMQFCLDIKDSGESSICVAHMLYMAQNQTSSFETCEKIENSTMKNLCIEMLS